MGNDVKGEQCATGGWYCHVGTLSVRGHGENWLLPMNPRGSASYSCLPAFLRTWQRLSRGNCFLTRSGTRLQTMRTRSLFLESSDFNALKKDCHIRFNPSNFFEYQV